MPAVVVAVGGEYNNNDDDSAAAEQNNNNAPFGGLPVHNIHGGSSPAEVEAATWFEGVLIPHLPRGHRADIHMLRRQTEHTMRDQFEAMRVRGADPNAVVDAIFKRCFHELYRKLPAFTTAATGSAAEWERIRQRAASLEEELGEATTTTEAWAARARAVRKGGRRRGKHTHTHWRMLQKRV